MSRDTYSRGNVRLSLHEEVDGCVVVETWLPVYLEYSPTRHPVPHRAHYGSVPGGWRPTRLLALADLLDMVLPHREGELE